MSMGAASRDKGKAGERELARLLCELTGRDVRRRVRQHEGDSDLEGVPGWAIECKRYATVKPADLARWWRQAVAQAQATNARPLLAWRADRMRDWCLHSRVRHQPLQVLDLLDSASSNLHYNRLICASCEGSLMLSAARTSAWRG